MTRASDTADGLRRHAPAAGAFPFTVPKKGSYEHFLAKKEREAAPRPVPVTAPIGAHLFPHQRRIVEWALQRGRACIFADTGLGKTAMQLEWARQVASQGRVLILAPLAVAEQTAAEARRWGIEAVVCREDSGAQITVANYDMLHAFDPSAFAGIVLDESSILKSFTGATRSALIKAFAHTPFRLCCTATPAPNDHTELGNHAEFLGVKSRVEMLSEYFCHDGGSTQNWRLKGHATDAFWTWVAGWAAVVRKPSDLGYSDDGFELPPLVITEHVVEVEHRDAWSEGYLFAPEARSLSDQRATRRMTMQKRVQIAKECVRAKQSAIVWCELNDEADECEAQIHGAVQIAGSDSPDVKAERLLMFAGGEIRVLVSKPSICGFGLNWQHCSTVVFVGASHSYEQTYQAIRRCWRFGQRRTVNVHVIRAETEGAIMSNFRRKEAEAAKMMDELSARVCAQGLGRVKRWNPYEPTTPMRVPEWLRAEP